MNKAIKIVSALMITLMIIMVVVPSFAKETVLNDIGTEAENGTYQAAVGPNAYAKINATAGRIIKIIRYVAVVAGVILIAIFGIKFMLGSAEEKAEYKKSFVPLLVGMILLFGASAIAKFIVSIASSAT